MHHSKVLGRSQWQPNLLFRYHTKCSMIVEHTIYEKQFIWIFHSNIWNDGRRLALFENILLYIPFRHILLQQQLLRCISNRMISQFQQSPGLDSCLVVQLDWNTQNVTYLIARYLSMHSWFAESETKNPSHINTFNYWLHISFYLHIHQSNWNVCVDFDLIRPSNRICIGTTIQNQQIRHTNRKKNKQKTTA